MISRNYTRIWWPIICIFFGWQAQSSSGAAVRPDFPGSQPYVVQVWQTDDGLPQNWVSSMVQTPDGYLWVGTRYGGIARFDGLRFVAFNPENTPELKDVQVEHAQVDPAGALWIIMGNTSITLFQNGVFHLLREPRREPRLRLQDILDVNSNRVIFTDETAALDRINLQTTNVTWEFLAPNPPAVGPDKVFWKDRAGIIWYITDTGGLARFRNGQFSIAPPEMKPPRSGITAITVGASGRLWAATTNQIFCLNGGVFEEQTPTNGPPPSNIRHLAASPDGGLWVYDGNHLRKSLQRAWGADAGLPASVKRDNTAYTPQLYSDSEGNAWLIDYGRGLWCVKADGTAVELTEANGLPSTFITCWFQDRENDIWVGTAGGGIARISRRVVHVLGQNEKLPGKIARSVCLDQQGTLWAGTLSGGLAYWKTNHFVTVPLPINNMATPLESVTVCPGDNGALWVGTLRHGLMVLQGNRVQRPMSLDELPSVRILFKDSQKRMWVGGLADLRCYENGRFKLLGTGEGFQTSIAVGAMAEDARGVIWIGTGPGDLWKYDDGAFTRYSPPREWPSFRFAALQTDADGSVWIGTLGGGLLRFKDGHFFRFTGQQGLPNMYISQLLSDRQGNLWAGTYAGIVEFSKSNLNAVADGQGDRLLGRVYGRASGLAALECSSGFQPSCWASPGDRLWFSTANGLAFIDPQDVNVVNRDAPPPVVIEEMRVDGTPRPIPAGHPLQIRPGQHFLQFRFTGLGFKAPDEILFQAKLEGAESRWQDLGHQRTVGYGPLSPGHYRLHVTARNSGGIWNATGALLDFDVRPFFWQTWGFKAGLVIAGLLLTAAMVTLILVRRHRLELQKLQTQHELDRERARIAQDLHDDLGTMLTQISLLSSLADREVARDEVKSLNQQIRGCARQMVVGLDEIVWAVNPRNDSLAELINYFAHFAGEFFRAGGIRCRLDMPDQLPARPLSSEIRHHLFLAFKESINNLARHSGAAHAWIGITATPDELMVSIRDDGHGFDAADPGTTMGDGLKNIRSRMAAIGGRADIQSAPGQGTTVTIRLHLK
jgi:signal transduction histidine kinase/streptogramin lyase